MIAEIVVADTEDSQSNVLINSTALLYVLLMNLPLQLPSSRFARHRIDAVHVRVRAAAAEWPQTDGATAAIAAFSTDVRE